MNKFWAIHPSAGAHLTAYMNGSMATLFLLLYTCVRGHTTSMWLSPALEWRAFSSMVLNSSRISRKVGRFFASLRVQLSMRFNSYCITWNGIGDRGGEWKLKYR